MITTIMAGFAFGYCVTDIILNYRKKKYYDELMKTTIEIEK
jgi:hypothetical protein